MSFCKDVLSDDIYILQIIFPACQIVAFISSHVFFTVPRSKYIRTVLQFFVNIATSPFAIQLFANGIRDIFCPILFSLIDGSYHLII